MRSRFVFPPPELKTEFLPPLVGSLFPIEQFPGNLLDVPEIMLWRFFFFAWLDRRLASPFWNFLPSPGGPIFLGTISQFPLYDTSLMVGFPPHLRRFIFAAPLSELRLVLFAVAGRCSWA